MRILMIAPQPFMEERGAPFAVYHHIKALLAMGFEVDLVTYHLGKPIDLPGLRVFRIPRVHGIQQVKVGPSLAKIPLDMLVFGLAFWRLCCRRYHFIHTHEEAGLIGVVMRAIFGRKHLYYMHSDLSQQVVSSEFTSNKLLLHLVDAVQKCIVRNADGVIAICADIEATAKSMAPKTPIYMIENCAVDENLPEADALEVTRLRTQLNLGNGPVMLYTGTLESYQGIDLLLQSIPAVARACPSVRYLLVGGQPEQVERFTRAAHALNVAEFVRFEGQRPLAEMPQYMALADILLSPRSQGTNTPLKLYTYLRSSKPILATSIYSQTQVLSAETAMLVAPTPDGLAEGAIELLSDPQMARAIGARGQQFAEERYSWPVFLEKCVEVQREFTAAPITLLKGDDHLDTIKETSCAV